MVRPETLVAVQALDERVVERFDVARRLPHLGRHEDGRVEPDDIVAELHHVAPPRVLNVSLELDTDRPVVPRRAQATVDLGRRKDQPSAFGEVDDGVQGIDHVAES